MMSNRTVERSILGVFLFSLILAHSVAFSLASLPGDAPMRWALSRPTCAMRALVGIPCPLCFGTTTFILTWRGYWGAAFRLDPLIFVMFWLSVVVIPVLGFLIFSPKSAGHWVGLIPRRLWVTTIAIIGLAVFANWFYLIATLSDVSPREVLARCP